MGRGLREGRGWGGGGCQGRGLELQFHLDLRLGLDPSEPDRKSVV